MSDKTGTLTRNIMKFKRCSVAGINFGNDEMDDFQDPNLQELITAFDVSSIFVSFFITSFSCSIHEIFGLARLHIYTSVETNIYIY